MFCREFQKRRRLSLLTLTEEEVSLLVRSLYRAHCSLILGKEHNHGYYRKLSDEFRSCFPSEIRLQSIHDPGEDAYRCGRLLLHYRKACFVRTTECGYETCSNKKATCNAALGTVSDVCESPSKRARGKVGV